MTAKTQDVLMSELNRYQALVDLARSVGRVMELHTLLDAILSHSKEVLHSEACTIFLPDPCTGELVINTARGDKAPLLAATRIPAGAGIAGKVYETRETLNIHDAQNDPRHYSKVDEKTGFVTRALLTVPLLNNNECMGVLQAINSTHRPHFDEKDVVICEAFAGLIVSALLRLDAQQNAIDEVRTRQELDVAREIQRSFLPETYLHFDYGCTYMHYSPARTIGGDFCFAHPCGFHGLLIGLGDVSGKGVPAALNMARATATIKALASKLNGDLASWVIELNSVMVSDLRAGRFIGLTFLYVDIEKENMQICTAGQYAPFHTNGHKWTRLNAVNQLPIGIMAGVPYQSFSMPIKRGDSWLLFSDGITEARNDRGEEWTVDLFFKNLPENLTAADTFDHIVDQWKIFSKNAPQHDDATLLLFNWRGLAPSPIFHQTCALHTLADARQFIETWAQYAGYDDITTGQIILACDEAVTNVYRYAYGGQPGPICFEVCLQHNCLCIQIKDEGQAVDPSQICGRELEDLRPGGLGTVLLSKIFDHVAYIPQSKGTHLYLKKYLPDHSPVL